MPSKFTLRLLWLVSAFWSVIGLGGLNAQVVPDSCPVSAPLIITVHAEPEVTTNGASTICEGGLDTLYSTIVQPGTGVCHIQWQSSANGTSGWADISGATDATYYTPAMTVTTYYRIRYFCDAVSGADIDCDEAFSNILTVTVVPDLTIDVGTPSYVLCTGGTLTFTAAVTGGTGNVTYQWQSSGTSNTGPWTNVGSNANAYTTPVLSATNAAVTTYYRVLVSQDGAGCDNNNSSVISVTTYPDPQIDIGEPDTICVGGNSTLTAAVLYGIGNCTIQWDSLDGATWVPIVGATATTYNTGALSASRLFRARYNCDGFSCNEAISDTIQIVVSQDPDVLIAGGEITICEGGDATLNANVTGGAGSPSYQWESTTTAAGAGGWAVIPGATNPTLNVTGLTQTTYYRVQVTFSASGCDPAYSGTTTINVVPDPEVSITDITAVCVGGSDTLRAVVANGTGTCTIVWQRLVGTTWQDLAPQGIAPDNSLFFTGALAVTTTYRVRYFCTGGGCNVVYSEPDTVDVIQDPTITDQPLGETICQGGSHTMTLAAIGGTPGLLYQWQFFNGTTWVSVANSTPTGATYTGATTNTLVVAGITAIGVYDYRAIVDAVGSNCDSAFTDIATIQVVQDPAINQQPVGDTICVGGQHIMNVVASGGTPMLNYQWEYNNGGTWESVNDGIPAGSVYTGGDTDQLTTNGITALGNHEYRVVVTSPGSDCNTVVSTTQIIRVEPALAITLQPTDTTVCVDGQHVMTVGVSGGQNLVYQWQYNNGGTWANVADNTPAGSVYSGQNTLVLTAGGFDNPGAYQYQLVATSQGNNCGDITSDAATITVVADPLVTVQPLDTTICEGGNAALSFTATGGFPALTYQWQYRDGGLWINVADGIPTGATYAGTTGTTLQVNGISVNGTYEYRSLVNASGNNCNPTNTATVEIIVVDDPAITAQPVGASICPGGEHTFSVVATNGTPSLNYQWEYFNGTTWNNVANGTPTGAVYTSATPDQLNVNGVTVSGNHLYRVLVTSTGSGCNPIYSVADTLIVIPEPDATLVVADAIVCEEGTTTITATVTGGTGSPTYQWQYRELPAGTWANVTTGSGFNTLVLTTPEMLVTSEFRIVVNYSGSGCDAYTSNASTVTVVPDPVVAISGVGDICVGGGVLISSNVTGGTGACEVQWQISTNNGTTFSDIVPPATGPTYQTPALNSNTQYRARIVCDGRGCCD